MTINHAELMKQALKKIAHIAYDKAIFKDTCPWCDGEREFDGHAPDCSRQLALAKARGDEPD